MKKELINTLHNRFEDSAHNEDGVEYWTARDLQNLLKYSKWDNFARVIQKAMDACRHSEVETSDHFAPCTTTVVSASGTKREVDDYKLTRYACYLVTQNGDPRKDEIAFAQTYFAVQTRRQEIIENRLKELKRIEARERLSHAEKRFAGIVFERGVDSKGFARIKSKGDSILFGGNSTRSMKDKLSIPQNRALADFLPKITLAAKTLADEITEHNLLDKDLQGEKAIMKEHTHSNEAVRNALLQRDIRPENLAAAEDIRKVQSRLRAESKKLPQESQKLPAK